jgi:acetyl esterase
MSYPFDPELAAAVAMMPVVEITDIPSARAHRSTCSSR